MACRHVSRPFWAKEVRYSLLWSMMLLCLSSLYWRESAWP